MPEKSLDQQRAAYAWQCVGERRVNGDYVNLAKSAPALIMSNGLMQTLAFYRSKNKEHHRALSQHIRKWLGAKPRKLVDDTSFNGVMQWLHGAESAQYMEATEEVLEILRWIRTLADARMKQGGE